MKSRELRPARGKKALHGIGPPKRKRRIPGQRMRIDSQEVKRQEATPVRDFRQSFSDYEILSFEETCADLVSCWRNIWAMPTPIEDESETCVRRVPATVSGILDLALSLFDEQLKMAHGSLEDFHQSLNRMPFFSSPRSGEERILTMLPEKAYIAGAADALAALMRTGIKM